MSAQYIRAFEKSTLFGSLAILVLIKQSERFQAKSVVLSLWVITPKKLIWHFEKGDTNFQSKKEVLNGFDWSIFILLSRESNFNGKRYRALLYSKI